MPFEPYAPVRRQVNGCVTSRKRQSATPGMVFVFTKRSRLLMPHTLNNVAAVCVSRGVFKMA